MKIAVMQPYFMPYIGYFQLISAVDKFIIYDDVNFIKQGWINRNNILLDSKPHMFSIPLKNASSFKKINEIEINEILFPNWKDKFFKTLEQSYKKAPYYDFTLSILKKIFIITEGGNISDFIYYSLAEICLCLNIETTIEKSSSIYNNKELSKEERLVDICRKENSDTYINPYGGQELYSKEYFSDKKINLFFLKSEEIKYNQFKNNFIPWLSIIDLLMFNTTDEVSEMLNQYALI